MSNVTAQEIIAMTARQFGVDVRDLGSGRSGRYRAISMPPRLVARNVAVYLALRHTGVSAWKLARMMGLPSGQSGRYLAKAQDLVEERSAWDEDLVRAIEAIEIEIDELHEARVAAGTRRLAEVRA